MTTVDIILAVILLIGLVRGLLKGLFVEITSLVALAIGVYGAIHFSHFTANYLNGRVEWSEKMIQIAAFAITFVIIVLLISLAGRLLTKLADAAALGIANKILGAVFGVIKMGLILSVILLIFDKLNNTLPFVTKEDISKSILYKPVKNFAPMLFPSILKKAGEEEDSEGATVNNL